MKRQKKRLAEVELEVMKSIWSFGKPVTVRQVLEHLYPNREKAYTTVQTIMNILAEKGFLRKDKVGMVNFYFPTISETDFAEQETHNLVSKIFHGSFGALANYLVDSGELSSEELNQLKALIESREKSGGQS
ncbi:MAG: BlaI/MecI/CopY family transcriptional regulator [Calditrichaeota bacterium]|nr:MAG: BlaI/MecI/CopY family transcriptional regulator [Calditrichota bacterium]